MDSSSKREIWEEDQFEINMSDDKPQFSVSTEPVPMVEIEEEKGSPAQTQQSSPNAANLFDGDSLEGDEQEIADWVSMSELDEIDPPDVMSYNPKFYDAA